MLHSTGRPSFTFGLSDASGHEAFEILANRARIAVSIRRMPREELGHDGLQRRRTWRPQGVGRLQRSDPLLESARVRRPKWLNAADHFVQEHSDGPEVRIGVDLARLEPLGRQVRDAAEVVARDLPAQRKRLGDSKVEDLDLVGPQHADVPRLQIAVQQRAKLAAVDRRFEAVCRFEEMTQLNRDADRTVGRQRAGGDDLREISPVEVLHRDVEISAISVVFVHNRHVPADATELLLKLRAPALRIEDFVRLSISSRRHQLQRNPAAVPTVGREKHDSHAAAPDLVDDLVRPHANALKNRGHHRPRRTRGVVDDVDRES